MLRMPFFKHKPGVLNVDKPDFWQWVIEPPSDVVTTINGYFRLRSWRYYACPSMLHWVYVEDPPTPTQPTPDKEDSTC